MPKKTSSAAQVGKYVYYQRSKRGFSLQHLANLTSLTPSFLLRLEQGEYQTIKLDAVEKLAAGFHMSVVEFLQKCLLGKEYSKEMPSCEHYFKEKYSLPPEAVDELVQYLEFIEKKYQKEISELKTAHERYWSSEARTNRVLPKQSKKSEISK